LSDVEAWENDPARSERPSPRKPKIERRVLTARNSG
jgi:hypothetical protein